LSATLQFLGAAGTVTGSMHLVTTRGRRILLDCGLFQGMKQLRLRNWRERVPDPASVTAVLLSHAHIDHSGYLPLLSRLGYRGPIYCTPGTADLLAVVLPDAARLQEEEADRANRKGYSKHQPALPLYTERDARTTLAQLAPRGYDTSLTVVDGATALLRPAGHILGSATVELDCEGTRLVFSGDLGRYDRPILRDPEPVSAADVLLVESTYGDRPHPTGAEDDLARVVNDAAGRGGVILVPAFAVDRTQELLWMLRRLERAGRVPALPVYIDSPMAIEVTDIYRRHPEDCDADFTRALAAGERIEANVRRDPVQPRLERRATLEAIERAPGPDHGLLHRVLGVEGRAEHAVAVAGELAAVLFQLVRANLGGGSRRHSSPPYVAILTFSGWHSQAGSIPYRLISSRSLSRDGGTPVDQSLCSSSK